ncbi:MAG: LysR family transcriptional regulator [Micropepsaceae bacterium]
MSRFNIRSLDLNLLAVFAIVWETRSVSRASERLALTQPAVSHALKRLRENIGDELFVPGRKGLIPTPRAAALIHPVRDALAIIENALQNAPVFAPGESRREFRIATVDFAEFMMLPMLLHTIAQEAPGVVIKSLPLPEQGSAATLLETGDVDVVVTAQPTRGSGIRCAMLTEFPLVTLIHKREAVRTRKLPLSLYLERPHVVFQSRGRSANVVDQALAVLGHRRKIGAFVHNALAMPIVAAQAGYVCTVPIQVADRFAEFLDLSVHRPPIELPASTLFSSVHVRFETDPGLTWLLTKIRDALN